MKKVLAMLLALCMMLGVAGMAAAEPIKQTKRAAPQPAQRLGAHTAAFAAAMRRGAGVNTEYAAALRRLACGRLRRSAALSV